MSIIFNIFIFKEKIMKKIIILWIILIFIFFNIEFLFFRVKVCNNTDKNISMSLYSREDSFVKSIKKYLFNSYLYSNWRNLYLWNVDKHTCTNFYNMDRLDKNLIIEAKYQNNIKEESIKCLNYYIDTYKEIKKMNFWIYILNINKLENKENNCELKYKFIKL